MPDLANWLTGRRATASLATAGAIATALLLYLNRGTTFYLDEMVWFGNLSRGFDLESILMPHNSHLIGTSRLFYLLVAELVGPDYVVFRVAGVIGVLACSALLFVWARRRVGDAWALLPAILLLFYGSAWQHVVGPIGFTITISIALGLGALLALERNDLRGDLSTCVLVSLAVFTYTVGLGYLVGVAISVISRKDRFRRAWIFLIPLLLYAAWWLWARQFDQGRTSIANASHVISFFGESMAVVSGALSGVSIPFSRFSNPAPIAEAQPGVLGWIVAALLVLAVAWRLRRGGYSPTIFASLGVLATYWLAAALSDPLFFGSQADAVRYVLPGSVGVLLVLTDAANGLRPGRRSGPALIALFVFSLAMNLVYLSDGAAYLRNHSWQVKGELAMLELANGWDPGGGAREGSGEARYQLAPLIQFLGYGPDRDEYLAAVAEYGSPADDLEEVRAIPGKDRLIIDTALQQSYALNLNPVESRPADTGDCTQSTATDGSFEVPVGGIYVRPVGADPVAMSLARFSPPPGFSIGTAPPGIWSWVLIPTDPAPEPWYGTVTAGEAEICPVPSPP